MPKIHNYHYQSKIIARGFTSVVYQGIDQATKQKVAIKTISQNILDDPQKKKMLTNQLNIQWQLKQQPHIVQIKSQFYQQDNIFIITQFCEYGDLKNKIKEKGKFVQPKAVSYMLDIVKGFNTLVKHKIVHRDLKSSNIFISKKGIKIGDFGFAYKTEDYSQTINVPAAGSPLYMAPEVIQDHKCTSHISDIWSLGIVFFQMITGRLPFPAKNKEGLVKLIQRTAIRSIIPQKISPKSKQFILRTLKKDPNKRMTVQQFLNFKFDDEIIYLLNEHRQNKLVQKRKRQEEGFESNSSEDNMSQIVVKNHSISPHQHHNKFSNQKNSISNDQIQHSTIHNHHENNKHFEPQKPCMKNQSNLKSINKSNIIKSPPQLQTNKVFDRLDQIQDLIQEEMRNNDKNTFKRHPAQKKTFIEQLKSQNLIKETNNQKNKKQLTVNNESKNHIHDLQHKQHKQQQVKSIRRSYQNQQTSKQAHNCQINKKYQNNQNCKNNSQKISYFNEQKGQIHQNSQLKNLKIEKNSSYIQQNNIFNPQLKKNDHEKLYPIHQSQPIININPPIEKTHNHKNNIKRADSIFSVQSEHHHDFPMKKQQIVEILLNQIDIIRFISRIIHKLQELHHLHLEQSQLHKNQSKSKQRQAHHNHHNYQSKDSFVNKNSNLIPHNQAPLIYIILKQFVYRSILQIQRLEFLSQRQAYKFSKSQQFKQIKVILQTYITKLHLQQVKQLKWKGTRLLQHELQKQIVLIYNTIKSRILKLEQKKLQNDQKQLKKLNKKIQALNYILVFKVDYLILQRQQIFIDQQALNKHEKSMYIKIKRLIQNKRQQSAHGLKSLQKCKHDFEDMERRMKQIKIL